MKSHGFLRLKSLARRWAVMMAAVSWSHAIAAPMISGEALLAIPAVTSTMEPGRFSEIRVSKEQSFSLGSGLVWETSTGLTKTQYMQDLPIRTQSARLTTGPTVVLGRFEFALPMQSGYEVGTGQGEAMWTTNSPRLTFAMGPNDRLKLELRVQNRTEERQSFYRKSKKSVGVSWRHAFSDHYSLRLGMGQNQEVIDNGLQRNHGSEVYAQMRARLPNNWQFSLLGSVQSVHYESDGFGSKVGQNQFSSLMLSANRGLSGRWLLSGSFSIDQNGFSGLSVPTYNQSGQLRLTRDF